MGWQVYAVLILLVAIVWGIRGAVRWWNLPDTLAARLERQKRRQDCGIFGRRCRPKAEVIEIHQPPEDRSHE